MCELDKHAQWPAESIEEQTKSYIVKDEESAKQKAQQ